MRKWIQLALLAATGIWAVGCQTASPAPRESLSSSRAVLDVRPVRRPAPTYVIAPDRVLPPEEQTPPTTVMPVMLSTPPDAASTSTSHKPGASKRLHGAAAAHNAHGTYKVKKGDTLFGIARTQYGDGKKWSRIASANPGLTPQTLKVGQLIKLP